MEVVTFYDMKESDRLKKEAYESCVEQLKGTVSDEGLKEFEESFKEVTEKYIFRRKEDKD